MNITRLYRAVFFKDDDDNTPQGKLARGCFYVLYWLIAFVFLSGITEWIIKGMKQ